MLKTRTKHARMYVVPRVGNVLPLSLQQLLLFALYYRLQNIIAAFLRTAIASGLLFVS